MLHDYRVCSTDNYCMAENKWPPFDEALSSYFGNGVSVSYLAENIFYLPIQFHFHCGGRLWVNLSLAGNLDWIVRQLNFSRFASNLIFLVLISLDTSMGSTHWRTQSRLEVSGQRPSNYPVVPQSVRNQEWKYWVLFFGPVQVWHKGVKTPLSQTTYTIPLN